MVERSTVILVPGRGLDRDPVGLDVEHGPEDARTGEDLVAGGELHEGVALAPGRLGPGAQEEHVGQPEDEDQRQERDQGVAGRGGLRRARRLCQEGSSGQGS